MNQHIPPGMTGDAEIIDQVIAGDVNAFEHLFKRYTDYVLRMIKKHIPHDHVEEIAQDVFIKAYTSLPALKKRESFKAWLSSITIKTCHDYWRKAYRLREQPISTLSEKGKDWLEKIMSDHAVQHFDEKTEQKEAAEILDWALEGLSADDRMVLELVYFEGLTCREAARLMGITVANVKIRSFRSRKKLEKMLAEVKES